MRAWIARMTEDNIDQSAIEKAGEILKNGGLAAFPTETVYGLGGNALDAKASEKIYAAKGRPSDNPLIVHIGRMEDLETVAANVPESARKLAAACWPGPLTIVFEAAGCVSPLLTAKTGKIGIRLSGHDGARQIALAAGKPLTATSANLSGLPECATADEVIAQLGDRLDAVVDLGNTSGTAGSTIIDTTTEQPVILRAGVISREEILQKTGI